MRMWILAIVIAAGLHLVYVEFRSISLIGACKTNGDHFNEKICGCIKNKLRLSLELETAEFLDGDGNYASLRKMRTQCR